MVILVILVIVSVTLVIILEMNGAADRGSGCYEYMTTREAAACKYQRALVES